MKRTITLVLALAVLLASTVPAAAQTAPPGSYPPGTQPPTTPYGNCNPYAVPEPSTRLTQNTLLTYSHVMPAVVQWGDIPAATAAPTHVVLEYTDPDGDDTYETVEKKGYTISPTASGLCAKPGIMPVIIVGEFVEDTEEQRAASFFAMCQAEIDELNEVLEFWHLGAFVVIGICARIALGSVRRICLVKGPMWLGWLHVQSVKHYEEERPIAGQAFYTTYIRLMGKLNGWCGEMGLI